MAVQAPVAFPPGDATANSAATALPETCLGCGAAWGSADCVRCGFTRADAAALLAQGCASFALARTDAQAGRFADAQKRLDEARAGGLALHPAVKRLGDLCYLALGCAAGEAIREEYAAAQAAVRRGSLFEAAIRAEKCTLSLPALLPAQKLRLLCLAAMGRGREAERLRRALLRDLPAEPDLLRWQFSPPVRHTVVSPRKPSRRTAPVSVQTGQTSPQGKWVAASGALCGFAALAVSSVTALRPAPVVVLSAPLSASKVSPPVSLSPAVREKARPSAALLPADLQRDYEESRSSQTEQQARRWLNEAVGAFHRGEFARAERFADAAFQIGPKTYLAEDALLLRAQAADNQKEARAVGLYVRLADLYPRSPYAPAALALAARAAQRLGNVPQRDSLRARLRSQYPNSPQAKQLKV